MANFQLHFYAGLLRREAVWTSLGKLGPGVTPNAIEKLQCSQPPNSVWVESIDCGAEEALPARSKVERNCLRVGVTREEWVSSSSVHAPKRLPRFF